MLASELVLNESDMRDTRLTDDYSVHRIVYDLFDEEPNENGRFLYLDKGGTIDRRTIIILSHKPPRQPRHGLLTCREISKEFLMHDRYGFEVLINPTYRSSSTSKVIPVRGRENLLRWFESKAESSWGFEITSLEIRQTFVKRFTKKNQKVTLVGALFVGSLNVSNRERFIESFQQGLGRGKTWGLGLLQLVPVFQKLD